MVAGGPGRAITAKAWGARGVRRGRSGNFPRRRGCMNVQCTNVRTQVRFLAASAGNNGGA